MIANAIPNHELSLVSAMLLDGGDSLGHVVDKITPSDFVDPFCGHAYGAISRLYRGGQPINPMSVADSMGGDRFDTHAVTSKIKDLYWYEPGPWHLVYFAEQVLLASVERQQQAIRLDGDLSASDAASQLVELDRRSKLFDPQHEKLSGERIEKTVIAYLESQRSTQQEMTVPGPHERFDKFIGGELQMGSYVVIGARRSNCKTLFLMQTLLRCADRGLKCCLFSQEMSEQLIGERLYDMVHEVEIKEEFIDELIEHTQHMFKNKYIVFARVSPNVDAITGEMRSMARNGVSVFGIDFLQLLRSSGKTEYEIASQVSQGVKTTNTELGTTTFMLSQLSRTKEVPAIPRDNELRNSGRIEEDADVLILLRYPRQDQELADIPIDTFVGLKPEEKFEIYVSKLRNRRLPDTHLVMALKDKPLLRLEAVQCRDEPVRVAELDDWNEF